VRHWIAVAVGLAALSCTAAAAPPSALVYDPFEPRSWLIALRAMATNFTIRIADYRELAEAAKTKFGDNAKTVLHGQNGKVETTLDGKVVETSVLKARVEEVFGIFLVGRRRAELARFPFALSVAENRDKPRKVDEVLRNRFEKRVPHLFDFTAADWENLACWSQEAPEPATPFTDAEPLLGRASLCLVRWQRGEPRTMLIGALTADGGDWVREASRPICRLLAAQWLAAPKPAVQDNPIDYVGCVLVHDPDRGTRGANETVASHLYELRADRSLALIN
jgi:hypothetical protein